MEQASRRILAISVCEGKRHDYRLLKDSKVRVKKEVKMVLDSGYQGAQNEHQHTDLPHKKPKKGKLTKEQKRFNKTLAQTRIINKNVIASIKRFRIMAEKYRNRRKRYGLRINLIAAIHNMELNIGISVC